jgi:hypothetical protein
MMVKAKHRRTTAIRLLLLALALVGSLSASGLALAQSTGQFDLACWGVFTAGGDLRVSTNARVQDAFGHLAVGDMISPTALVRQGHVQRHFIAPTPAPDPQPVTGENLVFLSSVWGFLKLVRGC